MVDWIAAILMFIGTCVLIKKHWSAWAIMIVGNALYLYWWAKCSQWPTFFLVWIFLAQSVWGLISWRRESVNKIRSRT